MQRFLDLADFNRDGIKDLLGLAARLQEQPQPNALAGKVLGLLFMNPSLRTLASFQSGMMRLGGSVFVITPAVEFSASLQRVAFRHATTAGYFAPHHVNLAELATYAEFESGQNGAVLAIDAGAGAEQITKFGASQGAWHPALRLWSQLTYPFTRTVSMLIEIDSYSTRSGPVVATAENWRSLALRTGARLGL